MAYVLKQRIYEIGVRKVLGASFTNLIILFGKEILPLLGLATLFSFPLALKRQVFKLYDFQPNLTTSG